MRCVMRKRRCARTIQTDEPRTCGADEDSLWHQAIEISDLERDHETGEDRLYCKLPTFFSFPQAARGAPLTDAARRTRSSIRWRPIPLRVVA